MFKHTLNYLVGCVPAHSLVSNLVDIIVTRYHLVCEMSFCNGELESLVISDVATKSKFQVCLDNNSCVYSNAQGFGCYVAIDLTDLVLTILYELVFDYKECDAVLTKLYHRFN